MLRDSILSTYEKTKPELLDKLMKTTTISGRPSLYLQELATLADRIEHLKIYLGINFYKPYLRVYRLLLHRKKDLSIQQIGKLADELLPFLNNTLIMAVKPPASTNAQTDQTDGRLNQTNNNSTKYGLRPYKPDQKQKICRAHLYFAERERNCTSWCQWPNKQNINVRRSTSRSASPALGRKRRKTSSAGCHSSSRPATLGDRCSGRSYQIKICNRHRGVVVNYSNVKNTWY